MNAQDLVIDRILAALKGAPAIAQGTVVEERTRPFGADTSEAVIVRFGASVPMQPEPLLGAPIDWRTTLTIEHHARGDDRTPNGRASRRLAGAVYARLMADPTLGGAVESLSVPRLVADDAQGLDETFGCVIAQYTAQHRSQALTLDAMP